MRTSTGRTGVATALPLPTTPLRPHIARLPLATAAPLPPTAATALPSRPRSPCSPRCSSGRSTTPALRPSTPPPSQDPRSLCSPSTRPRQGATPTATITAATPAAAEAAAAITAISTTTTAGAEVMGDLAAPPPSPITILHLLLHLPQPQAPVQFLREMQPQQPARAQRTTAPPGTCCPSTEKARWACAASSLPAPAGPWPLLLRGTTLHSS